MKIFAKSIFIFSFTVTYTFDLLTSN